METPQEYYRRDGPMTAPGHACREFSKLPRNVARLCEVVQGLLIHRDIAPFLYDLKLTEAQREDGHLRPVAQMLTRIHELDSRPITVARSNRSSLNISSTRDVSSGAHATSSPPDV